MKFLCGGSNEDKQASKKIDKDIYSWYETYKYAIKILLLGTGEAGKTTILKQMKILHIKGFTDEERSERAAQIRKNVHEAAVVLAKHIQPLGLEPAEDIKNFVELLVQSDSCFPSFTQEYYEQIKQFWEDENIKKCYNMSNEFQLMDNAEYFLNKIEKISQIDYIPDDDDILQCRQMTTGIQKIEFKVKVPKSMQGGVQEFWMFDVGGQRGERKKWIQVFEGIHAIWFLVASSDFDQTLKDDTTQNKLRESLTVFEDVWRSRFLLESGLIVFLNKQDILERKIKSGKKVMKYFPEYESFENTTKNLPDDEYSRAKLFIKQLFVEVTQNTLKLKEAYTVKGDKFHVGGVRTRECYYHFTIATSTDNIETVFNDIHHIILTKNFKEMGIL